MKKFSLQWQEHRLLWMAPPTTPEAAPAQPEAEKPKETTDPKTQEIREKVETDPTTENAEQAKEWAKKGLEVTSSALRSAADKVDGFAKGFDPETAKGKNETKFEPKVQETAAGDASGSKISAQFEKAKENAGAAAKEKKAAAKVAKEGDGQPPEVESSPEMGAFNVVLEKFKSSEKEQEGAIDRKALTKIFDLNQAFHKLTKVEREQFLTNGGLADLNESLKHTNWHIIAVGDSLAFRKAQLETGATPEESPREEPTTKGELLKMKMEDAKEQLQNAETDEDKMIAMIAFLSTMFEYMRAVMKGELNEPLEGKKKEEEEEDENETEDDSGKKTNKDKEDDDSPSGKDRPAEGGDRKGQSKEKKENGGEELVEEVQNPKTEAEKLRAEVKEDSEDLKKLHDKYESYFAKIKALEPKPGEDSTEESRDELADLVDEQGDVKLKLDAAESKQEEAEKRIDELDKEQKRREQLIKETWDKAVAQGLPDGERYVQKIELGGDGDDLESTFAGEWPKEYFEKYKATSSGAFTFEKGEGKTAILTQKNIMPYTFNPSAQNLQQESYNLMANVPQRSKDTEKDKSNKDKPAEQASEVDIDLMVSLGAQQDAVVEKLNSKGIDGDAVMNKILEKNPQYAPEELAKPEHKDLLVSEQMHIRELEKAASAGKEWGPIDGYGITNPKGEVYMYKLEDNKLVAYTPGDYQSLDLETGVWKAEKMPDGLENKYAEVMKDVDATGYQANTKLEGSLKGVETTESVAKDSGVWTKQNTEVLARLGQEKPAEGNV